MAVEATRIKGRFKALFPKANLSTKRLDELSARLAQKPADDAEDSAIDELLNDANDVYPFEEMAKDEHRLATAENKLKNRKPGSADDQDPPQDPPQDTPKDDADMPAWARKMYANNEKLLQEVTELKTGKIIESKKASAAKLFNENATLKGLKETVKEKWLNRIDVESETSIEDQIADLETEYTELVQVSADDKKVVGAPPNGSASGKPTDAELDSIANGLV